MVSSGFQSPEVDGDGPGIHRTPRDAGHDEVRTVEDLERPDIELITWLVEGEGDPRRPDLIGAESAGPPGSTPGPRVVTVIVRVGADTSPLWSTATT
jgi:hypothetical protein